MRTSHRCDPARGQRGVVLIYALIAMVVIMLASLALIRGVGNSTTLAGSFGMRRDMVNQADRGVACALLELGSATDACTNTVTAVTATLANTALRNSNLLTSNYSATALATAANGIPNVLLETDASFSGAGYNLNLDATDPTYQVNIRFVIDRLCSTAAAPSPTTCVANNRTGDKGGTGWLPKAGTTFQPIYRISVRVTGPKNAVSFVQTMIGA
jgi:hypothetical protein